MGYYTVQKADIRQRNIFSPVWKTVRHVRLPDAEAADDMTEYLEEHDCTCLYRLVPTSCDRHGKPVEPVDWAH